MSQVTEFKKFYDNGNPKRQKENFQDYLFDGFKQEKSLSPVSFYRSDFRGAKIQNCLFVKNNFSRADFIDCAVEFTSFSACLFKFSEFQNCFFSKSGFEGTSFTSASFNRLLFDDCDLSNASFHDITARDCTFKNCKFWNVKFSQNSFDQIRFDRCHFVNIDLSNMTAINFYFTNCTFDDIVIEADYLGSYFFKGTHLDKIKLKYRGKLMKLDIQNHELFSNLFKIFLEKKRYYEAINIYIQGRPVSNGVRSISEITFFSIKELLHELNFLKREYALEKIFQIYEYYFNSALISMDDYFELIAFIQKSDVSLLSIEEQLLIKSSMTRLLDMFNSADLSDKFIETKRPGIALFIITIDDKGEKKFLQALDEYVRLLVATKCQEEHIYSIIGKRAGSIIMEIAIHSTIGLYLLRVLRSGIKHLRGISNDTVQIVVDANVNRKLLAEAKKAKSLEKLKQIKQIQILSEKAITGQTGAVPQRRKRLTSSVKSARYFPDTLY
jgi:uncharacterized protein YjbI with pentapeptide repeats